jgi:hypothetical protein
MQALWTMFDKWIISRILWMSHFPHMNACNFYLWWNLKHKVGFEVLMAMSMEMAILSDAATYSLIDIDQHFRRAYCLHHQAEMLVNTYKTTKCYIPEYSHVQAQSTEIIHALYQLYRSKSRMLLWKSQMVNFIISHKMLHCSEMCCNAGRHHLHQLL